MTIPTYQALLSEVIERTQPGAPQPVITIPVSLLKYLLQSLVSEDDFDEEGYRAAHPDIAQAVDGGDFVNGLQHFLAHGYFEGRIKGAIAVDEAWYRAEYPDVDAAIRSGEFDSAADHFFQKGLLEWRSPRANSQAGLARWRDVLRGGALPLPDSSAGDRRPLTRAVATAKTIRPAAPALQDSAANPTASPPAAESAAPARAPANERCADG